MRRGSGKGDRLQEPARTVAPAAGNQMVVVQCEADRTVVAQLGTLQKDGSISGEQPINSGLGLGDPLPRYQRPSAQQVQVRGEGGD